MVLADGTRVAMDCCRVACICGGNVIDVTNFTTSAIFWLLFKERHLDQGYRSLPIAIYVDAHKGPVRGRQANVDGVAKPPPATTVVCRWTSTRPR